MLLFDSSRIENRIKNKQPTCPLVPNNHPHHSAKNKTGISGGTGDIVAVLTYQNDYTKTCNYWKYLKAKLKKENSQVVSATTQLKFRAPPSGAVL